MSENKEKRKYDDYIAFWLGVMSFAIVIILMQKSMVSLGVVLSMVCVVSIILCSSYFIYRNDKPKEKLTQEEIQWFKKTKKEFERKYKNIKTK